MKQRILTSIAFTSRRNTTGTQCGSTTQIGQHLNKAFSAIEDANLPLRGVFGSVDFANQECFPDA
jgi:hypothetical protein